MTQQEQLNAIMEQLAQLKAENEALKTKKNVTKASLIVKPNEKGGLFIYDTRAKAFSENKGKEYVASINIGKHQLPVLQLLLDDKTLREAVKESMSKGVEIRK